MVHLNTNPLHLYKYIYIFKSWFHHVIDVSQGNHVTQISFFFLILSHKMNVALITHLKNNKTTIFHLVHVRLWTCVCVYLCYRLTYIGRPLKLMQHIRNSRREQRPEPTHTLTHRAFVFHYLTYREPSVQINEEKSACLSIFLTCKPVKTHTNAWIS